MGKIPQVSSNRRLCQIHGSTKEWLKGSLATGIDLTYKCLCYSEIERFRRFRAHCLGESSIGKQGRESKRWGKERVHERPTERAETSSQGFGAYLQPHLCCQECSLSTSRQASECSELLHAEKSRTKLSSRDAHISKTAVPREYRIRSRQSSNNLVQSEACW